MDVSTPSTERLTGLVRIQDSISCYRAIPIFRYVNLWQSLLYIRVYMAFLRTSHIWADGALLGAPQDFERKSSAKTPSSGYHWNDPNTVCMQPNLHWVCCVVYKQATSLEHAYLYSRRTSSNLQVPCSVLLVGDKANLY
jgi:hypothetical protein